jgi:hypothetical protein
MGGDQDAYTRSGGASAPVLKGAIGVCRMAVAFLLDGVRDQFEHVASVHLTLHHLNRHIHRQRRRRAEKAHRGEWEQLRSLDIEQMVQMMLCDDPASGRPQRLDMGTATGENHQCTRWCVLSHVPLVTLPLDSLSRICCARDGDGAAGARATRNLVCTISRVKAQSWCMAGEPRRDSRVPPSEPPCHTRIQVVRCVRGGHVC